MSVGKKTTFWEFICSPEVKRIEIPQIQRDYVQGRDTAQVRYARGRMLDEIQSSIENKKHLDLNFVYGRDENGIFIPIDGQQRLTTLLSLHIYAFAKDGEKENLALLGDKFTYLTRTSTRRFLNAVVHNIEHCFQHFQQTETKTKAEMETETEKEKNKKKETEMEEYIKDAAWYSPEWDKDPSIRSFVVVLSEIHARFFSMTKLAEKLKRSDCPVSFMSLKISDIGFANDLYIKMNSRGKPLTEFEAFKSELFDYLDETVFEKLGFDKANFKKGADNEWLSMIWDLCAHPEQKCDSVNKAQECDSVYMAFLHQIIMNRLKVMNRLMTDESENHAAWNELKNNDGFFNFANYKPFLSDAKAIRDVYYTLELCSRKLIGELESSGLPNSKLVSESIKSLITESGESERLTYRDQVRIAAITQYATSVPEAAWNIEKFLNWYRIINNLINNSQIDKEERFISACNSIYSMEKQATEDTNSYFASITSSKEVSFFFDGQIREEILKCKLIKRDDEWLETLVDAERHKYFNGQIMFALALSGINDEELAEDQPKKENEPDNTADPEKKQPNEEIERFKKTWSIIEQIFTDDTATKLKIDDSLFRRGLLTYGDYSIDANLTYTLFFEGGKGYFNWRRMLGESSSLEVFQSMFDELVAKEVTTSQEIEEFLKRKIDDFISDFNDTTGDKDKTGNLGYMRYYFVKIPDALNFMREKRLIKASEDTYAREKRLIKASDETDENRNGETDNNRNLLYRGARVSAGYAEAYSFFVYCLLNGEKEYHYGKGYLGSDSTAAYIEKANGESCYITFDYKKGYFVNNYGKTYIDKSGYIITTVEDMAEYLNSKERCANVNMGIK